MMQQRSTFFFFLLVISQTTAFLQFSTASSFSINKESTIESSNLRLYAETTKQKETTNQKPLYDGTNYTFPDTTQASGIAEIVEVTFVNACMQLRTGFVDVLKMFIAAAVAGYEFGYGIGDIQEELVNCKTQSANRPLMEEEVNLRYTWYCLVYLTLASLDHPSRNKQAVVESIPDKIRKDYQESVEQAVTANSKGIALSAEDLVVKQNNDEPSDLSIMEKAIMSQSMRLITMTFTVLRETQEAQTGDVAPPTPPIEGAF